MKKLFDMSILNKVWFFFHYNLSHRHKLGKTQVEKLGEIVLKIYPTVFNPASYLSSKIFTDFIQELPLENKFVLDMGCGSGIISIVCAKHGARCTAVDINEECVKAAEENVESNKVSESVNIHQSDLYSKIDSTLKFDYIFFNPPYYKGEPENDFERAFKGGMNLELIKSFIKNSGQYLNAKSKIYLILSNQVDIRLVEKYFYESGFEFNLVKTIRKFAETFYIYESFVKIYTN